MGKERTYSLFDLAHPEKNIFVKLNERNDEDRIISELMDILLNVDESDSFSSTVLYYFRRKHLTTKELYDRAFIDRRLFHKIVRRPHYHPSKNTVFALCVALELNYIESLDLLGLAGYAFASNSRSDTVFRYFLMNRIYDIDLINDVLYHFGCPCIGE